VEDIYTITTNIKGKSYDHGQEFSSIIEKKQVVGTNNSIIVVEDSI
jgi:hypothetical protein